ncbi:MAG: FKBP-type peptidyl-prolyl cis-trans isomerase [Candidatus Peribacteria bacterium]|jgi:peptidylprolyl isomerase|nr:FKBP-type peptidyl-prolyl cis-trans isomerase [Candidatus Peribacteria bacterium]
MIAGFDAAVVGMKLGQTKTITIPAKDAYGERSEEYIQSFPLSEVPNPEQFQEGMKISLGYGMNATVAKITNKEITLDMNHELAGKDLIFDITVKSIN